MPIEKKDAGKDLGERDAAHGADWDQKDVLEGKDQTTEGAIGLQIWGDGMGGDEAQRGKASEGTAARSARITGAQERAKKGSSTDSP